MRKKDNTLRDKLLHHARNIADTDGIDAINIRSIAQNAGVATGTVYNYFSCKDDILLALTEEYWNQTLTELSGMITADSFCEQLEQIYLFLRKRMDHSAGRLMNSLQNVETLGQERMLSMQMNLEAAFIQCMEHDTHIRQNMWDETFTIEQFSRFIMQNMTIALKTKAPDIHFLIEIVKRTIY